MSRLFILRRRWAAAILLALVATVGLPLAAYAESIPGTPIPTATAAALPTVQLNGVVYSQVIVGDTVYATGAFTSVRPSGAPAGINEAPRSNLVAYQLSTGQLNTTWAPTLNGTGLVLKASADGATIYVGGSFTQVNGTPRSRLAAINATTGALTAFNPSPGSTVRALDLDGNTLYPGGDFTSLNGQARSRIGAIDATIGTLLAFAPNLDAPVYTLLVAPGGGKLYAGGRFRYANSEPFPVVRLGC